MTRVSGKKLGVVGMGRIGRAVARRARGFSMEVRYHSRRALPELSHEYEGNLAGLARWADFLVVCTPGGRETRRLVSADILQALGSTGYLINIGRGTIVDESKLVEALSTKTIAGAALDVFENEPRVPQELMSMENVVLLPHIASNTRETFEAMENLVIENLHSFFNSGRVLTPVF
jgi:lactate dehydrogenase-like 2-hydroxyacid dehydrogenase